MKLLISTAMQAAMLNTMEETLTPLILFNEKSSCVKSQFVLYEFCQITRSTTAMMYSYGCRALRDFGDIRSVRLSWWHHHMETFSALLAIIAGKSPVTCEFPTKRPVTRNLDVSFDLHLNKRWSKQSWGWWFETASRPLWLHCNVAVVNKEITMDWGEMSPPFSNNATATVKFQVRNKKICLILQEPKLVDTYRL